jgi:hypothetical protein
MPIDIAALAAVVVTSFLVPYAKIGLEKLAEGLGEKLGEIGAEQGTDALKKVWGRVKGAFKSKDEKPVWAQFEKHPEAAQGLVQEMLKEKLAQDPALAQELSDLVNAPLPSGASTGAQITNADIAAILDLRGADFSGAKNTRITGVTVSRK